MMARQHFIVIILCAWITTLTLLLTSYILTGHHSDGNSDTVNDQQQRTISATTEATISKLLGSSSSGEKLTKAKPKPPRTFLDQHNLSAILSASEGSNPRAEFDKVVALSSLLPKITKLSRMKTPSPETFRNYIAPAGLPVIFTDMLTGEKLGEWTWEYVRHKWGKTVYRNTRQGNYSTKTSNAGKYYVNRVTVTLEEFIDYVMGKKTPGKKQKGMYIAKKRVIPLEALEAEFCFPPFYPAPHKNCYLEPTGWIGSPGTFTQGHIDSKDNFVYQILGQKRWTIFPPSDYKFLYYKQTKGSLEWSFALNTFTVNPDLEKFPLYAKTSPVSFVMSPGEVLYLPRGWTHTVANLTPTLMINTWRYGPAAITQHWVPENDKEIRKRCY